MRWGEDGPDVFEFRSCTVTIFDKWIRTKNAEDEEEMNIVPPIHHSWFKRAAKSAGYIDVWQYAREHELIRAFLSDVLEDHIRDGDPLIDAMQLYINRGEENPLGLLRNALGPSLGRVTIAAILKVRPWLSTGFAGKIWLDPTRLI